MVSSKAVLRNIQDSLLIILIAAILCGCQKSQVERQLDHAESIMEEHPDSALTILRQIDGTTLHGEPQARHALLLSQAYDKNYIDLTNDSLISIATNYYNTNDDLHRKMISNYYRAAVLMNKQDYVGSLSEALNVEMMATVAGDSAYLARTKMLIARAYLYSLNTDGAEKYLHETLNIVKDMNNHGWKGLTYYNLADLELRKRNFSRSLEYLDSARLYIPYDEDIATLEIFDVIGLGQYARADSIYAANGVLIGNSIQLKAYHILTDDNQRDTQDSNQTLRLLLSGASRQDSIDIVYIANKIALKDNNYQQAYNYTNFLLKESNRIISKLSEHSLYLTHLEHEKLQMQHTESELRNKHQIIVFILISSILVTAISTLYILFLNKSHKLQKLRHQKELLLLSSEFNSLRKQHTQLIEQLQKERNHPKFAGFCGALLIANFAVKKPCLI